MATFFDSTTSSDVDLLYAGVRDHDELVAVVDEAERQILQKYTIRTGVNTYRVELEGYDDVTPADSHASLKEELRQAVAKVASWRLRFYDDTGAFQSETLGDYEYDHGRGAGAFDTQWPSGWDEGLDQFYSEIDVWIHI